MHEGETYSASYGSTLEGKGTSVDDDAESESQTSIMQSEILAPLQISQAAQLPTAELSEQVVEAPDDCTVTGMGRVSPNRV